MYCRSSDNSTKKAGFGRWPELDDIALRRIGQYRHGQAEEALREFLRITASSALSECRLGEVEQ